MRPPISKVTLEKINGHAQLRVHGSRFERGYTVSESVRLVTGTCLTVMRKDAKAKARMFGVQFTDYTTNP